MQGLILNEEGYVTYPYKVFKPIEQYVRTLNWRITNAECGGDPSYVFHFENELDYIIDGDSLMDLLAEHSDVQWWWGSLSGFPKDVSKEAIQKKPVIDLQMEQPYLKDELHHLEPEAVLEVIAFDSTETYVLVDDVEIADKLKSAFPNYTNLDKYVYSDDDV